VGGRRVSLVGGFLATYKGNQLVGGEALKTGGKKQHLTVRRET